MTEGPHQQGQYIEKFGQQVETARVSTLEFWKHLTLIQATVLGLSVGLAQGASGSPTAWLIASWVALLLAIAVGCLLIKIWIDVSLDGSVRAFRFAHDIADIQDRVERGELIKGSEEHIGLFSAALRASAEAGGVQLTAQARELADKYADKLSMAYIGLPRRGPVTTGCTSTGRVWPTPSTGSRAQPSFSCC